MNISENSIPDLLTRYIDSLYSALALTLNMSSSCPHEMPAHGPFDNMILYHLGWKNENGEPINAENRGKCLRPTLCLFACEALGGDWTNALPAAVALELIHNFSLIHDDIQDEDTERRHRPTVWTLWGKPKGILIGNTMRCLADQALFELSYKDISSSKIARASYLLTWSCLEMIKGQSLDLEFEGAKKVFIKDYMEMIAYKTGTLISCSMELGALMASDDPTCISAFAECGVHLGLAFQIRDDVLGIWGQNPSTGKTSGNDIRKKKKSFPIVYAFENSRGSSKKRLSDVYSKPHVDEQDVLDIMYILNDINAESKSQESLQEKIYLALDSVKPLMLPPWATHELVALTQFLADRQY